MRVILPKPVEKDMTVSQGVPVFEVNGFTTGRTIVGKEGTESRGKKMTTRDRSEGFT